MSNPIERKCNTLQENHARLETATCWLRSSHVLLYSNMGKAKPNMIKGNPNIGKYFL